MPRDPSGNDKPNFIHLKEKIALSADFTPHERDLILESLNLGDYRADTRVYPANFGPGSRWSATMAWSVVDMLRPDALPVRDRFQIAGAIAGALEEVYDLGRRKKKMN